MEPTLEYKMGYAAGITIVVVPAMWITGKVTSQVASLIKGKTPQTFRETGSVYYSRKGLDTLKKVGDTLALPGDGILFLGYVGVKMAFDSLFSKQENGTNELPIIPETHGPDTVIPFSGSYDTVRIFSEYIRELPEEIRKIFYTCEAQENHAFYKEFLKMHFEARYSFADELISNKAVITSMRDIFLILAAWKAGMRNIELVHNATISDGGENDDTGTSLEGVIVTQEQIQEMRESGILSEEEADFLSFATKNPGK